MEQRLSLVTLGVADLARARRFYEEGLGWRRANDHPEVAFYQAGGLVLALWGRDALADVAAAFIAIPFFLPDAGSGFRAIALAYNTRERAEVDAVLREAEAGGGRIVKPAHDTFFMPFVPLNRLNRFTLAVKSSWWKLTSGEEPLSIQEAFL